MITIEALKQEDMPQLIELYKELIPPHIEFNTSLERCLKTYKTMEQDDCSIYGVFLHCLDILIQIGKATERNGNCNQTLWRRRFLGSCSC